MADKSKNEQGPKFTEPTPKLPKRLEHPSGRSRYPEFRQARGETVMSYPVFCGITRDNVEKMLEGQAKTQERRTKRVKS